MSISHVIEMLSIVTLPLAGLSAFSCYSNNSLFEFTISVIPEYLALLLPGYIPVMYIAIIPFLRTALTKRKQKIVQPEITIAIDIHRALIQITTTICIFMCDFSFWVERFGKIDGIRQKLGMGFMDTGVGAFLFNAGLFSSKATRRKTAINAIQLFVLGFIRLFVVKYCNLYVNPYEYGFHLNFYFILCFMNVLFLLFNTTYNFIAGFFILLFHEFVLIPKFSSAVLSNDRSNLILQNKEGLFSILPYFGWFLICNSIGTVVLSKKSIKTKIRYDLLFCLGIVLVCFSSSLLRPVNRLTSSLSFTSTVIFVQMYSNTACMIAADIFSGCFGDLSMIKFVSRNMFWVFLYTNLFVLFFKLVWDGYTLSLFWSHTANIVYLVLSFVVFPVVVNRLRVKGIKR